MGIYDRPYYQDDEPRGIFLGGGGGGPQMLVTKIVLVNVGIYILDAVFLRGKIGDFCAAHVSTLKNPLLWWQYVTYGFMHDPKSIGHVGFNMFGLWMFGREVEMKYGRQEFLRLYFVMIIFSGVVWSLYEAAMLGGIPEAGTGPGLIGASGAVVGVILLFALNVPKRTVLFPLIKDRWKDNSHIPDVAEVDGFRRSVDQPDAGGRACGPCLPRP